MFAKRLIEPELLDHLPADEARPNLVDLTRINRHFGGHSVLRKTLARAIDGNPRFSLLDVGAASGDSALLIRELYPGAWVASLDYNAVNLEAAPRPKLIANAFALPFPPGSFDYVMNCLFLHHFSDEQAVELLHNFYVVARHALVVIDLERHILPYWFLPATKRVFGWKKITVHDGRISVRAAFRAEELRELARRAGIEGVTVEVHRPSFRIALVAQKEQAAS